MSKLCRNDPCFCGSGKKYKKCCLNAESKSANTSLAQRPVLLKTLTDEFFQPMRLYYTVYDVEQLKARFRKLKCIGSDDDTFKECVLFYKEEAAKIPLRVPPHRVPKEMQPLVIATLYMEDAETLLVDVRSIERAARIMEFLDRNVSRKVMKVTHAAIYNRIISAQDRNSVRDVEYDEIFHPSNITIVDPKKSQEEIESIRAQYEDEEEAKEAIWKRGEENAKKPFPLVEKIPVHYYEEGVNSFEFVCQFRQVIAVEHFLGKKDYSLHDLMQELA